MYKARKSFEEWTKVLYFVVIPAKVKSVVKDIPGEVFTQKLVSNHTEAKVKVPKQNQFPKRGTLPTKQVN